MLSRRFRAALARGGCAATVDGTDTLALFSPLTGEDRATFAAWEAYLAAEVTVTIGSTVAWLSHSLTVTAVAELSLFSEVLGYRVLLA